MNWLEIIIFAVMVILVAGAALYSMRVSEEEVQNPHITTHTDSDGHHVYSVNVSDSVNVREGGA